MVMVDMNRLGMRLYMGGTDQETEFNTATAFWRPYKLGLGSDSAIGYGPLRAVHSSVNEQQDMAILVRAYLNIQSN